METTSQHATIKEHLCRLARFGANISDAHSCLIFVPSSIFLRGKDRHATETLELGGFHTLSTDIVEECRITAGGGLIGWVVKHRRSIHVSPFDRDSRTLGFYRSDQDLKSFIGIPILLDDDESLTPSQGVGVIACDSKKSYAFSKIQGKLLENLSHEVANTLNLLGQSELKNSRHVSWHSFVRGAEILTSSLGTSAVEVIRFRPLNIGDIEERIGTRACIENVEQVYRLIEQSLPPHFPTLVLPNGDIIVVLDNMVGAFYENKVRAISSRVSPRGIPLEFKISRCSLRDRKFKGKSIEDLVNATLQFEQNGVQAIPLRYEARSA